MGRVHTLVWRSVQFFHELQELEEEEKGSEEVQEIEVSVQSRRTTRMDMTMEMT